MSGLELKKILKKTLPAYHKCKKTHDFSLPSRSGCRLFYISETFFLKIGDSSFFNDDNNNFFLLICSTFYTTFEEADHTTSV